MKIVYMGTPIFAVPSLKALIDAGHEIQLVVTQPDRKGNRGKIAISPVKELAVLEGIDVSQPNRIRKEPDEIEIIKALEPDIIVVAAFGQILPKEILDIPRYGCVNVHGSLLPKLRGASPMQRAILQGDKETGVTIMKMAEGLDTGDMISKVVCNIEGKDIFEVSDLLSDEGAKLLVSTLEDIENGTATYTKQNEDEMTYAPMINKLDGMTGFDESAEAIDCKVRAYKEWPTLFSFLSDKQVMFYDVEPMMDRNPSDEPGTIFEINKNDFVINCKEGQLRILELQMQGKKRMKAGDFLRGGQVSINDRFCIKED